MTLLGIDTGGTFTDFVYHDGNRLITHKVLSTPDDPVRSIVQGMREMGISLSGLRVIHGSTVATNAVLEGKGARTVYITNRGFGDVLTIGRQARRELYNLQPEPVNPPVPDELLLETGGRLSARGEPVEDLTDQDLEDLRHRLAEIQPDSAAINLLFSFLDPRFEQSIKAAVPANVFACCSSDILREYREYERGITTWLNAYVGPLMQGYLQRLHHEITPAVFSVMRSSGETCAADQAGTEAVHLMLSGPAGGLAGAGFVAARAGFNRIMTFDMGGTSTDVALQDGSVVLTNRGRIAGYPVGIPMVDMHTIGAGGGSIASIDAGGGLRVGPQSAGAAPGPVCYGQGGTQATVTDANLVLGRLPATVRLGGSMELDVDRARESLARLAERLDLASAEQAAEGVIRIVNEHMVQALRVISLQRGHDPREFVLVAFGGAGGMHVCDLADALGIRRALAPQQAGVLSALGMLVAPAGRQLSQTLSCKLEDCSEKDVEEVMASLRSKGQAALVAEGIGIEELIEEASLDLCYQGQGNTLNFPWAGLESAEHRFHEAHLQQYGHRLEAPVELVNIRLGLRSQATLPDLPPGDTGGYVQAVSTRVYGYKSPVAVLQRAQLGPGKTRGGPLIICDAVSTTLVTRGWRCESDQYGNIVLNKSVTPEHQD